MKDEIDTNRLNHAFSLILIGEESKGKEEIQKLKDENPNSAKYDMFIDIDKNEYFKSGFGDEW